MSFDLNSVIISPTKFVDEYGRIVPESGIEDRYNLFIHDVCNKITSFKDDNSDGIIRIDTGDEVIYGIQEVKRLATTKNKFAFDQVLMQSLAYVAEFKMKYPQQIERLKFLILPTESSVRVLMLKHIHPQLLNMFIAIYIPCKVTGLFSASTCYKNKASAPELEDMYWTIKPTIMDKILEFRVEPWLDYKDVVEFILKNLNL